MDPTRAALEDAVAANFGDLTVHNAYSDYLSDRGDPRGEFIRLQIFQEDATLSPDAKAQYEARFREMVRRHGDAWLGPLAEPLFRANGRVRWDRGWARGLSARRFDLDLLEAVSRCPVARTLEHFAVSHPFLGDAGVELLLSARWLHKLRTLELTNCGITDDGAERLAAHPAIRNLFRLNLSDNDLSPIGIEALKAAGHRNIGRQRFGGTGRVEL